MTNSLLDAALEYADKGVAIHPLVPQSKRPLLRGWLSKATTDRETILGWWRQWPDANIGCVPGLCNPPLVVIDIDPRNGGTETWKSLHTASSPVASRSGSGQGGHLYYRSRGPVGSVYIGEGVELRYLGNIVMPPSVHPSGGTYTWVNDFDIARLPEFDEYLHERSQRTPVAPTWNITREQGVTGEEILEEAQDTAVLLRKLPPEWCADRNLWLRVAMATKLKFSELGNENIGFHLWDAWSSTNTTSYNRTENRKQWASLQPVASPVTWGAIIVEANLNRRMENARASSGRRVYWAADALQEPEPVEWLVEGLFAKGSVVSFVGEAGSKKSYSAMSLAAAVSQGKPWLSFPTIKTPVLFVDEEHGLARLHRRLNEVLKGTMAPNDTPLAYITLWGFQLITPESLADLEKVIEETKAGLVVLDSFIDFLLGGDENASADIQAILHGLRDICDRRGVSFLIIHHLNKVGTYRGSSALPGAVELMLELSSKEGSTVIEFESVKVRDIENVHFAAEAIWEDGEFRLESMDVDEALGALPDDSGNGSGLELDIDQLDESPDGNAPMTLSLDDSAVLFVVRDTPGQSLRAIAQASGLSVPRVSRSRDSLVAMGLVRVEKKGKANHLYPEEGTNAAAEHVE